MQRNLRFLSLLLFLSLPLFIALSASPLLAQETDGLEVDVEAGYGGYYKADQWVPFTVSLRNVGSSFEADVRIVVDETGFSGLGDLLIYNTLVSMPTQSNKVVTLYAYLPGSVGEIKMELRNENGRLLYEEVLLPNRINNASLLYGVVGEDAGELAYLEQFVGPFNTADVAFLEIDDLPETAVSLNNLDLLIFSNTDSSNLTPNQLDALTTWITGGGQLVVTGGGAVQTTVNGITDLLPVTINDNRQVDNLPEFNDAISTPYRDPGPYLITDSSLRAGELIYREGSVPILAQQSLGRGNVFFLALDPRTPPLIDWDGSERLWETILDELPTTPPWSLPFTDNYSAVEAASNLPSLRLPPVWQLLLFIFVYIVAIGPVNYLILKRRRQLEWAWVTIPLIVLLFGALTFVFGAQLRGNTVLINEMTVAYSSAQTDEAKVQTLIGIYTPRRTDLTVTIPSSASVRPLQNNSATGSQISLDSIQQGTETVLAGLRTNVGDINTFSLQTYANALPIDGQARLETDGSAMMLSATIQNNSDQTLQTAVLLINGNLYEIGDIPPGSSQTVEERVRAAMFSGSFNSSILTSNSSTLLGSSSYYNDPILYPRYQLLAAIENRPVFNNTYDTDVATLIGWTETAALNIGLNRNSNTTGTTLHFIDLPFTRSLGAEDMVIISAPLLDWSVLESSNVYSPTPEALSFNGRSTVAFEYIPVDAYQTAQIDEMTLLLNVGYEGEPVPLVSLWDWEQELWVEQPASWGETAVGEINRYIGPQNAVRLQLVDQSQYGVYIDSVYPILTGNLDS